MLTEMPKAEPSFLSILDDLLMVALAFASAAILAVEYGTRVTLPEVVLLDRIDFWIAIVFLAEFCVRFLAAPEKGRFFKTYWWELLASIPVSTPETQALRLLRLLRLFRLVRLSEGAASILDYLKRFVRRTHLAGVFLAWFGIVLVGTGTFYWIEHLANPNVHSLFDSFWWAISTITTVGYGDIYPVTVGGRIVAMVLMLCGIGTTGVITGLVASFLVQDKGGQSA